MLPWRCPDAAKQGRAVLACPRESESALSVVGVACLRTPDPMTTRCSPANCLGWVIRSDTKKLRQSMTCGALPLRGPHVHGKGTVGGIGGITVEKLDAHHIVVDIFHHRALAHRGALS